MKLYIKNMVSICCRRVVKSELKKLGLYYVNVHLGEVEIQKGMTDAQREQLGSALQRFGLELIEDKKSIIVERIKNIVVESVHSPGVCTKVSFSTHIARKLKYHYTYLSNLFSEVMGTTIEQYLIAHKVERVKELIFYNEHNLTEISFMLNYSSVAHLSNQFKKVTGMAPSHFKKLKIKHRQNLDEM
jgi:AraC-like DNA-binding protein